MNNRASLFLNIFLLLAVIVLFYLHYSGPSTAADAPKKATKTDSLKGPKLSFDVPTNLAGARVLYVNTDSINLKYQAIVDLTRETESYLKGLEGRYQRRQMELQEQTNKYQQRVQANLISATEAENEEKSINAGIEELGKMERELSNLQNNAFKRNEIIVAEVSSYFKEYSKTKGIDFILGYGSQSNLLYANDSLDVTADVLKALNDTYATKKGVKKTK